MSIFLPQKLLKVKKIFIVAISLSFLYNASVIDIGIFHRRFAMIELTMQVSEFDYTETLDTFLPDLIKILSESEGVNPLIRKCVGASPEFSKKIVKGILAAMSPKQKEALTVKFLNVYASKLVAQVNEVAAKNGIIITLDNARATIK